MKIYIYNDKETANRIARTLEHTFGIIVEQRGTALKIAENLYEKLINTTYAPRAAWTAKHLS